MTYRITAPVEGFAGEVAGLSFTGGVATGEPGEAALAYFRRRGYHVEEEAPAAPPARSASKADWRAYAIARGMAEDDADKATRDQLAETYHGPAE